MKVIIVGGVAGGASAATRLRRLSEGAEIVLFERGEYVSYANCGLPYYIGGAIHDKARLVVVQPQILRDRFRIDVRTLSEVTAIDRASKRVTVVDLRDGRRYEESYDKLVLSPGAEPKRPPLPGLDSPGVFTLRTVPDTFAIDEYIKNNGVSRAVVVGAGFIGVEMAENLRERGLEVTLVEFLGQALSTLDPEMAAIVHHTLRERGVSLILGAGVQRMGRDGALQIQLTDGQALTADMAILAIGVTPDSKLAREAGLDLGPGGSIAVDDTFRTSDPDIYAVGDAVCVKHLVGGAQALVPLAGPANKQGRLAAENLLGKRVAHNRGVQGSAVLKVFDLTAASTGLNEKQLKAQNIPFLSATVHPLSHAGYYPGAAPMTLKLLFSPDGPILGAQAVGYEGVDKRIDVLATALRLGATVYDLEELELCYAPPYSSAKDPVNMAGFTAANILRGDVKPFYYDQVDGLDRDRVTLLDVSTPDEVIMGTLSGAVNIPVDELRGRLNELPRDRPVYVFCRVGLRGYVACRILTQHGYDAYNLSGGYKTYAQAREDRQCQSPRDCAGIPLAAEAPRPAVAKAKEIEADACGLQCPGPIMKVAEGMKGLADGEVLLIRATDPAFASDVKVWCERTGNTLLDIQKDKSVYAVRIQKGGATAPGALAGGGNDKSIIVFSGDLDKVLASMIIANGAAAMGRKVTLFFTFWGLNALRKNRHVRVKKGFIERMFGMMMPRGSRRLGLSRMNMLGIGPRMIRGVMGSKNVSSLEELMTWAMGQGVRLVACQMSMDIMGIKPEELIDGVEIGGVATFLGSAEQSDTNLFI